MKPLVIYHANCVDGFAAAYAAWTKLGDDAEYLPCQYGKQRDEFDPILCEDRDVYILDFSFPKKKLAEILTVCGKAVMLDHHKTVFEDLGVDPNQRYEDNVNPYRNFILDPNKSGAILAWEYFHPDTPIPTLFKHVDDYDRWQFKLDDTKEINKGIWSHAPWTFEQWHDWIGFFNSVDDLQKLGEILLKQHNMNVKSIVEKAAMDCIITGCFDDIAGRMANCSPMFSSDVGHELANQSGTFGLTWTLDKRGQVLCSLRSNGDYDVSHIAKRYGGGGHKNAAGFTTTLDSLVSWMRPHA